MSAPDVAIISPYPRLRGSNVHPSGVAAYTARLADALAQHGLGVHVVAPRVDGERAIERVGDVVIERRFSRGARALPGAARVAEQSGAPVVHLQHEIFLFGGPSSVPGLLPALAMLRHRRVGPVVTMHQVVDPTTIDSDFTRLHRVPVPPRVAQLGLSALQHTVRQLSGATVVHEPSFQRFVPRASVVQHGVDQADVGSRTEAKAALGLHPSRLTVLCFGFLSPYKGLEAALEAAEEAGPAVELVVAGGEHPRLAGVDTYAAELRHRYGSTARFVGYVPDHQVATWFGAADVLLLLYPRPFAASGPYALALGFGTPILCSPQLGACFGAPAEMIVPTGRVALARHLTELASHPDRLEALRQLTKSLAIGRTWEQTAKRHVTIYEEVTLANRTPCRSIRTRQRGG